MGVLEDAFQGATTGLDFMEKLDRFIGAYVTRRAEKLHQQKPSADGSAQAAQIVSEQNTIKAYIARKATELIKGPDPKKPAHLDLTVMANVGVLSVSIKTLEKTFGTNGSEWTGAAVNRLPGLPNGLRAELSAEA